MIKETAICDVCGAEKKEVNNWYVITATSDRLIVDTWGKASSDEKSVGKHVCGQACAHKLLNEFFERRAA